MPECPAVALVTLDDGSRFAIPTEVANKVLAATHLSDEQKMSALLTYPNLVEATSDAAAAEDVARLESQSLGDCPIDVVSMEIMDNPQLREVAFRVPRSIQESLDALPEQQPEEGTYHE